ncbi:uncharacterized protein LOC121936701 isoform X2 [Sceloporus undulatus]|nr:uncharacterized protein LOC121936701 isoform X2 [Sceloporus undulatus]XP_042335125.1 uncharacterized protein LOC121936701 isoform X2 [Sceloporus undulatus]XP_042335126.1 uncharacterized protein LOC121936701 isoform X2 [Sceloporus undulatus]XP_042335127.1 uncharacterized protein LOC121936701 isoform X2 [Sceloporus undulatus]
MLRCRKRDLWIAVPFLILLCVQVHNWITHFPPPSPVELPTDRCRGKIVNNTITALKHNKTFVISSYHDNREQNLTRVIAIVAYKNVEDLYCWFCCSLDGRISVKRAAIAIHQDRVGSIFGAADIVCLEPQLCYPKYVSIHSSPKGQAEELPSFEIQNRLPQFSFSAEFTLCLSVMFENYSNVLQFIQSMEMYKILGAQKVVIYLHNCSQLMEQVLNFYVAEGTVEVIPWPIVSYINFSSFWYSHKDWLYGKATVLNDCIYRNMYRSKYVVLNDIEEIILPIKHLNWRKMISSLVERNPEAGIFLFENNFFPQNVFSSVDNGFDISLWKNVPGTNILQHIYKEPSRLWLKNPRRMIVDPRKVVQTSSSYILQGYSKTLDVPRDVGMLYNCRDHHKQEIPDNYLIRDTAILRFGEPLVNKVNQAFVKMFVKKTGKFSWNKYLERVARILK